MLSKPSWSALVGGEQGPAVDFESQQVADGGGVFGAIEPMDRDASRIRDGRRGGIERAFQLCGHGAVCGRIRPRHTRRRHFAGAKFARHLFPNSAVFGDVRRLEPSSSEPAVFSFALWQVTQYFSITARAGPSLSALEMTR